MTHNKGKKYRKCPACDRKRYISYESVNLTHTEGTCSKGHKWVFKTSIHAQMIAIEKERVMKNIDNIFERDNTFYKLIKGDS